jgi:methylase of polypeptide subunit release factors
MNLVEVRSIKNQTMRLALEDVQLISNHSSYTWEKQYIFQRMSLELYRCEDPGARVYRPSDDMFLLADALAAEVDLLRRAHIIPDLGTGGIFKNGTAR